MSNINLTDIFSRMLNGKISSPNMFLYLGEEGKSLIPTESDTTFVGKKDPCISVSLCSFGASISARNLQPGLKNNLQEGARNTYPLILVIDATYLSLLLETFYNRTVCTATIEICSHQYTTKNTDIVTSKLIFKDFSIIDIQTCILRSTDENLNSFVQIICIYSNTTAKSRTNLMDSTGTANNGTRVVQDPNAESSSAA
jgi:hypothetical protein